MYINVCTHTEIAVYPLPCGEISRVVFIGTSWQTDVVRFRGRLNFEVWQDFEEYGRSNAISYVLG